MSRLTTHSRLPTLATLAAALLLVAACAVQPKSALDSKDGNTGSNYAPAVAAGGY